MTIDMTGTIKMKVSEILDQKGISTAEFAEKTGFAYNTALSIRRGNFSRIGLDTLYKICEVLDVDPGDVFEMVRED